MGLKIEFSWNWIRDYLLDLFPFISVKETSFLYQSSLQNEVIFKRQTPAAGVQLSHPLCCLGRPTKDSSLPDIYSCFMVACIVFIGHELFVVRLSLCEANSYQFFIGSIKYVGNFSDRKLFLKNHYLNEILQTVERRAEKVENNIKWMLLCISLTY